MPRATTLHRCANPTCEREFYPWQKARGVVSVTCSHRCRGAVMTIRQTGKPVHPAVCAALAAKRQKRVEAATREFFGRLSKREMEIFRYALQLGRKRGRDQRYFAARKAAA